MRRLAVGMLLALAACGDGGAKGSADLLAPSPDLVYVDKAKGCVDTFGSALTDSFGRIDGTLVAVVQPSDKQCTMFNSDHLVLEIEMQGAVYRAVVNVISDRAGDQRVRFKEQDAPLAVPFAEGWHTDVTLDYPTDLDAHNYTFEPYEMQPLIDKITALLTIGQPISVFTISSGGSSSHLVHRNRTNADGAIVINPTTSPHYVLLAFETQSF